MCRYVIKRTDDFLESLKAQDPDPKNPAFFHRDPLVAPNALTAQEESTFSKKERMAAQLARSAGAKRWQSLHVSFFEAFLTSRPEGSFSEFLRGIAAGAVVEEAFAAVSPQLPEDAEELASTEWALASGVPRGLLMAEAARAHDKNMIVAVSGLKEDKDLAYAVGKPALEALVEDRVSLLSAQMNDDSVPLAVVRRVRRATLLRSLVPGKVVEETPGTMKWATIALKPVQSRAEVAGWRGELIRKGIEGDLEKASVAFEGAALAWNTDPVSSVVADLGMEAFLKAVDEKDAIAGVGRQRIMLTRFLRSTRGSSLRLVEGPAVSNCALFAAAAAGLSMVWRKEQAALVVEGQQAEFEAGELIDLVDRCVAVGALSANPKLYAGPRIDLSTEVFVRPFDEQRMRFTMLFLLANDEVLARQIRRRLLEESKKSVGRWADQEGEEVSALRKELKEAKEGKQSSDPDVDAPFMTRASHFLQVLGAHFAMQMKAGSGAESVFLDDNGWKSTTMLDDLTNADPVVCYSQKGIKYYIASLPLLQIRLAENILTRFFQNALETFLSYLDTMAIPSKKRRKLQAELLKPLAPWIDPKQARAEGWQQEPAIAAEPVRIFEKMLVGAQWIGEEAFYQQFPEYVQDRSAFSPEEKKGAFLTDYTMEVKKLMNKQAESFLPDFEAAKTQGKKAAMLVDYSPEAVLKVIKEKRLDVQVKDQTTEARNAEKLAEDEQLEAAHLLWTAAEPVFRRQNASQEGVFKVGKTDESMLLAGMASSVLFDDASFPWFLESLIPKIDRVARKSKSKLEAADGTGWKLFWKYALKPQSLIETPRVTFWVLWAALFLAKASLILNHSKELDEEADRSASASEQELKRLRGRAGNVKMMVEMLAGVRTDLSLTGIDRQPRFLKTPTVFYNYGHNDPDQLPRTETKDLGGLGKTDHSVRRFVLEDGSPSIKYRPLPSMLISASSGYNANDPGGLLPPPLSFLRPEWADPAAEQPDPLSDPPSNPEAAPGAAPEAAPEEEPRAKALLENKDFLEKLAGVVSGGPKAKKPPAKAPGKVKSPFMEAPEAAPEEEPPAKTPGMVMKNRGFLEKLAGDLAGGPKAKKPPAKAPGKVKSPFMEAPEAAPEEEPPARKAGRVKTLEGDGEALLREQRRRQEEAELLANPSEEERERLRKQTEFEDILRRNDENHRNQKRLKELIKQNRRREEQLRAELFPDKVGTNAQFPTGSLGTDTPAAELYLRAKHGERVLAWFARKGIDVPFPDDIVACMGFVSKQGEFL